MTVTELWNSHNGEHLSSVISKSQYAQQNCGFKQTEVQTNERMDRGNNIMPFQHFQWHESSIFNKFIKLPITIKRTVNLYLILIGNMV